MKKYAAMTVLMMALGVHVIFAADSPSPAQNFSDNGFFARLGFGLPVPVGPSADVLTVGVAPIAVIGYQLGLGPGQWQ